jgi:hypothetical protein
MSDRLLTLNAFTTFDTLDAEVEGHDFEETAYAVLNVTAPRRDPENVTLELELDGTDLETLRPHADRVRLSADEARKLAAELTEHADRIESEGGTERRL